MISEFLPQGGKNLLTAMPQRVIFSLDSMPQGGKTVPDNILETPDDGRKDART
jgi:hypothetical protein